MPLIYFSNHAPSTYRHEDARARTRRIAAAIRDVCLKAHETVPGLKQMKADELAINALGENLFPDDGSPIQVVFQILYRRDERTTERLTLLGQLIADAVQKAYPLQGVKITFPPLLDVDANVIIARQAQVPPVDPNEDRLL